jgi:hypothetical protein
MRKQPRPARRDAAALLECIFIGGLGAALIRNDWRFLGVCVIFAAVGIAIWLMLRSDD